MARNLESESGPHLQNVNMDPLLNGRWKHYLNKGTTLIGKSRFGPMCIEMIGPGYLKIIIRLSFHL